MSHSSRLLLVVAVLLVIAGSPFAQEEKQAKPDKAKAKEAAFKEKGKKANSAGKKKDDEEYYELLKLFVDTLDQVDRNYVDGVSRRELMEAAIEGMLKKLDQYSNYISPDEIKEFRDDVDNEFGGVGIQVSVTPRYIEVISPLYGSPAYKAGVLAGDRIVRIEGESTEGMTLDSAVKLLKGKPGTTVNISLIHPGDRRIHRVPLKRAVIRVPTVVGHKRRENDTWDFMLNEEKQIGYIRLTAFGKNTTNELRDVLRELHTAGLKGLVMDLRFNPGGLLSAAIEVSDMFIEKGLIVATEGRNVARNEWRAHRQGTFKDFPMAILVNRYSASASEIVSACLKDHKRAVVVGERTWGKGSVQNVITLEGGKSAIKLTTATYHRPNGKNIHRFEGAKEEDEWGVKPNDGFKVRFSFAETRQLDEVRRQLDVIGKSEPEKGKEKPKPFVDRQLDKAIAFVETKLGGKKEDKKKESKKKEEKKKVKL